MARSFWAGLGRPTGHLAHLTLIYATLLLLLSPCHVFNFLSSMLQRDTIQAASEFAARNKLTEHIKDQMLSHICLRFKTEGLKQHETLTGLPKGIRSSIAYHLFFPVVQKVYLFQGVSSNFIFQLVQHPKFKHMLQSHYPQHKPYKQHSYANNSAPKIGYRNAGRVFSSERRCNTSERSSIRHLHIGIRNSGQYNRLLYANLYSRLKIIYINAYCLLLQELRASIDGNEQVRVFLPINKLINRCQIHKLTSGLLASFRFLEKQLLGTYLERQVFS